jgi:hypothetical protein
MGLLRYLNMLDLIKFCLLTDDLSNPDCLDEPGHIYPSLWATFGWAFPNIVQI